MISMCLRNLGLICFVAVLASAQELDLPWGPVKRLVSPDRSKTLYGRQQLWIEDTRSHKRTKLFDIPSTQSAAWSADGSAFYVNDHRASDEELAYIYDAATLERIDIAGRIQAEDPKSLRFADGHAYFRVTRWEGTEYVAVSFFGHTDEAPVMCFGFRYRISRDGVVKKLSQHVTPATATFCDESP